jgi:sugar phosphate isomerase/epimerase
MTNLSVSTHWIAPDHANGSAMIEEINQAGFSSVELGYDTLPALVPGIKQAVAEKRISVRSLHNFCPVPDCFTKGHPELFSLASLDPDERQSAVYHTKRTLAFAAEIGAEVVVTHAGNVTMPRFTEKLAKQYAHGKLDTPRYDRLRSKAYFARKTPASAHFSALCLSIEELLPEMENLRIKLAFENLPSVEAIPTPEEQTQLFERFPSPFLCYWHDFGHAQIMQHLQIAPHFARLQRFHMRTAGVHIHDTTAIEDSHQMPPLEGGVHWHIPRDLIDPNWCLVLEPKPGTSVESVQSAARFIEATWHLTK